MPKGAWSYLDRRLFMAGAAASGLMSAGAVQARATATTVFHGGPILTMDDAQPSAEAVAVRGQTILAVGALDAVRAAAGRGARLVDLDGRTLLPGFFDPHGTSPWSGCRRATPTSCLRRTAKGMTSPPCSGSRATG